MTTHPPGLIGLPCSEQGRFSNLLDSVVALSKPPGTKMKRTPGLGVAAPLNTIGRMFMQNASLEWLFLINDDNTYPTDTLIRLLDMNVDVACGLYLSKFMPFEPVAFDAVYEIPAEKMGHDGGVKARSGRWYRRLLLPQTPNPNPIREIVATGDACLLVRRRVMESIAEPWWEYGETVPDACDHDMVFSRKIREAGYKVWMNTDVRLGHMGIFEVRPVVEEGEWRVHLTQGGDRTINMPRATSRKGMPEEAELVYEAGND